MDACHSVWGRHRYRLGALVIMPDHWHALIKPQDKEVIESIVGSIKQRVFHASRRDGGVKKVIRWQKRFMDHRVRNEEDYLQHLEYMRLNPYKHQLVNDEKDHGDGGSYIKTLLRDTKNAAVEGAPVS